MGSEGPASRGRTAGRDLAHQGQTPGQELWAPRSAFLGTRCTPASPQPLPQSHPSPLPPSALLSHGERVACHLALLPPPRPAPHTAARSVGAAPSLGPGHVGARHRLPGLDQQVDACARGGHVLRLAPPAAAARREAFSPSGRTPARSSARTSGLNVMSVTWEDSGTMSRGNAHMSTTRLCTRVHTDTRTGTGAHTPGGALVPLACLLLHVPSVPGAWTPPCPSGRRPIPCGGSGARICVSGCLSGQGTRSRRSLLGTWPRGAGSHGV